MKINHDKYIIINIRRLKPSSLNGIVNSVDIRNLIDNSLVTDSFFWESRKNLVAISHWIFLVQLIIGDVYFLSILK